MSVNYLASQTRFIFTILTTILGILLFPFPIFAADSVIDNPTRLSVIYVHPKDRTSGAELSTSTIAQKFDVVIYHRQFNQKMIDLRNAGFNGEGLQYILHDEIAGPFGLDTVASQTVACSLTQKSFAPAWHNTITYQVGEFCKIHDSIVSKTAFDHDLNPVTANIIATESWFLHDNTGKRILQTEGMPNGTFYRINPANQHLREYFIAMALREMTGATNYPKTNFDGVFLDNIQLSWNKVTRTATPREFTNTATYADAVHSFVSQIYTAFHSNGNNFLLFGNMIEGNNDSLQWDRYSSSLDGGLLEDFALNWGNGYHSNQTILNQLIQAEKWLNSGKHYLAVSQGDSLSSNNDNWARFALASFLMITDGKKGSFAHASKASYGPFFDYPEYYYRLGPPKGPKNQVSTNPLIYRRDFECGHAQINLTDKNSSINYTSGCIPVSIPSTVPIASPSPLKVGDLDGNYKIDIFDYNILVGNFGKTGLNIQGDINTNGKVDIFDYNLLMSNFNK